MTRAYAPGELKLALLGDLSRNPATTATAAAERLDVYDPHTIRVTLGRMSEAKLVRKLSAGGWMLTAAGRDYIKQVKRWLDTEAKG